MAQGGALLARRCVWGTHPQVRILLPPSSFRCGRAARRAAVNREAQVRSLPPELFLPPWSKGDDAGISIRKLRVRVPPGVFHIWS